MLGQGAPLVDQEYGVMPVDAVALAQALEADELGHASSPLRPQIAYHLAILPVIRCNTAKMAHHCSSTLQVHDTIAGLVPAATYSS